MKKYLALLLTLAMILTALSGCGNAAVSGGESAATPEAVSEASAAEAPAAAAPAEEAAAEEPAEEEASEAEPGEEAIPEASAEEEAETPLPESFVPVEYSFPLVEKTETLSYFTTVSPMFTSYMEDYSVNDSVQALEEMTGVHIEYECYIPENAQTQFNLQAAGGSLPDMLLGATEYYAGGMDKAVGDDILLNLGDYLDDCPNFSEVLRLDPDMESALTTPSGNLIGFYSYSDPAISMPVSGCLMVRGDWLERSEWTFQKPMIRYGTF